MITLIHQSFESNEMRNVETMWTKRRVLPVLQSVDLIREIQKKFSTKFDQYMDDLPIQFRDPAENGIKANGERSSDVRDRSANRSGSNFSGFG